MGLSARAEVLISLIKEVKAKRVAEIGLGRGRTTRAVLESDCNDIIEEYWAVDPWSIVHSRDAWCRDQNFFDKEAWDVYRYMCFFPQLKVVRMTSIEASKLFLHYKRYVAGKYFDLVFIDAEHDYDNVKRDILAWYPLVKEGGIICGHDYASREPGVIKAVNEIYGEDNVEVIHPGSVWVKKGLVAKKQYIDRETGIWDLKIAKKRHRYDDKLAECIATMYKSVTSIADVGCGIGDYCKYLKEQGIPIVHGYEGTIGIKEIASYDDITTIDLTKRRCVGIDYKLVLCLEVGEHIPKTHEQVFIDNICEFMNKDLILSWGIPGQGGAGHFNEQPNEYVIDEFTKRGLIFDEDFSMRLRDAASFKWFKNTLMKFEKV